jgi:hypothetical protein
MNEHKDIPPVSQPKTEKFQTLLDKLQNHINLRKKIIAESERQGIPFNDKNLGKTDQPLLWATEQLLEEKPPHQSGLVTPPLESFPDPLPYDTDYNEARNMVKEAGLSQLKEVKNTEFSNSTWVKVVRNLEASSLPDGKAIAAQLVVGLEERFNHYGFLLRQLTAGKKIPYNTYNGPQVLQHELTLPQELTPRLFAEKFTSWPSFQYDIPDYSLAQLEEIRKTVGVAEYFQNNPKIQVTSLYDIPREPKEIELGRVYQVAETDPSDNSNELFRENLTAGRAKKPIIRHVVFFTDPSNPNQILRYSDHGLASDRSAYNFKPAIFSLRPFAPNSTELAITYIDHRVK